MGTSGHGKILNGNIVFKFIKHAYPSITVFQLGTGNYTSIAVLTAWILWFLTVIDGFFCSFNRK